MQMAGRRVGWGAAPRKRAVPPRPRPAGTGKARQGQGQDSGHEAPPRANVLSSALGVLQCPWVCNFWGQQADMKRICCCTVAKSCPTLCNPMDCVVRQAPLSMGFPRQDSGVGCHFLLPGICLDQGSNPRVLHWQAEFFTTKPPGKPIKRISG